MQWGGGVVVEVFGDWVLPLVRVWCPCHMPMRRCELRMVCHIVVESVPVLSTSALSGSRRLLFGFLSRSMVSPSLSGLTGVVRHVSSWDEVSVEFCEA